MAQKGDGLMDSRVADLIICRPEIAAFGAPPAFFANPGLTPGAIL
jgi:hypothetical protein